MSSASMLELGIMLPVAPAVYIGHQEALHPMRGFPLFNLTADIPGHCTGSTVSDDTLMRAGYQVPPHSFPKKQP